MKRITLASGALLIVSLYPLSSPVVAQNDHRITGTYTDMYFNKKGGDVLGEEIRIVATAGGYQGAVQFAEGVPSDLILVSVTAKEGRISFVIPDSTSYGGRFEGSLEDGVLKGEFHFSSGTLQKVVLRRGKSYWD